MSEQAYFIETIYGSGEVIVKDNVVSESSPVYASMIGKKWDEIIKELIRLNSLKRYEILF